MRLRLTVVVAALAAMASTTSGYAWSEPADFRGIPWGASIQEAKQKIPGMVCVPAGRCRAFVDLGPTSVYAFMTFRQGGLDQVDLTFEERHFQQVKALFTERYGEPTGRQLVPVGQGPEENEILEWAGTRVHIALRRFGRSHDVGAAVLRTLAGPEKLRD
jgi:hypothetical protein